jgi:hypothetical protein
MGTEYTEVGIIVALWGQETSSVYSVCSVVLYPQHTQAGGHHGIHGIHGSRHYCGALGARNIVRVFCVFSGPLSAAYSGWGAPRNTRNTRKAALLWRIGGQETSSVYSVCSVVLYPQHTQAGGHHGTTEYTEYPEGGIIVAHWGQETSSVYSVCSVVLYPQHTQAGGGTTEYPPVWARKVVVNGLS